MTSLTLEEVAKRAGVSRSTVSRVINHQPSVSEEVRQRVWEVIRQTDYHPNLAARSLASQRSNVIGLVIPMGVSRLFVDPFFPILIQGVTSTCNAKDYSVMLWLAEPEYERRMISQIFSNGLIGGVIIASMLMDDSLVSALSASTLPFTLVGRHPTLDFVSYVDADNHSGAREAVARLLRTGRKRVATITGPQNMIAGYDRLQGYLAALRERGIPFAPELVAYSDFSEMGGYEATKKLILAHPDGIFAASDSMAVGALRALREARLRVPHDVALIGFDDIPFAAHMEPPLTTIRQPIFQIGAVAAENLIQHIEDGSSQPSRLILPTELVIRSSC